MGCSSSKDQDALRAAGVMGDIPLPPPPPPPPPPPMMGHLGNNGGAKAAAVSGGGGPGGGGGGSMGGKGEPKEAVAPTRTYDTYNKAMETPAVEPQYVSPPQTQIAQKQQEMTHRSATPFLPKKEGETTLTLSEIRKHRQQEEQKYATSTNSNAADAEPKRMLQTGKRRSSRALSPGAALPKEEELEEQEEKLQNIHSSPLPHKFDLSYVPPIFPKSEHDREFITIALQRNFVFANSLSEEDATRRRELYQVVDAFELYTVVERGEVILSGSEVGDYFYILREGAVDYLVKQRKVGQAVRPGQSFGELCLLYDCVPPAECISATSPNGAQVPCDDGTACKLWRINKSTFRQILAMRAMQKDKSFRDALKQIRYLDELDGEFINRIAEALIATNVEKGEMLYKAGDKADTFYLLGSEGSVGLTPEDGGKTQQMGPLEAFGEEAIISDSPRTETAIALERTALLSMSKPHFDRLVGSLKDAVELSRDRSLLKSVPLFRDSDFEDFEIELFAALIETVNVKNGKEILIEGEVVMEPALHIVREGSYEVFSQDYPQKNKMLRPGEFFGEETLTPDENMKFGGDKGGSKYCEETIECISGKGGVLGRLTLANIDSVILDLHRIGCHRRTRKKSKKIRPSQAGDEPPPAALGDIDYHRLFGAGTFGRVWIVSRYGGKTPYALKIQSKRQLLDSRQAGGAQRERAVMAKLDHPFVCKLVSTFQDDACIYMLLTLIQGGELLNLIQGGGLYGGLPESAAKFYAAGILEGLTYMHRRHIVYRDLKPENVLVNQDGYPIIVDFGFSKIVVDKTYTFCGTPLYLAPEIILSRGHDRGVDYWSLGCLIYEMLFGVTPFYERGLDQKGLFTRIVRGRWKIPDEDCKLSRSAIDLIWGLLQKRNTERLGCLAGGYREIKNHPWMREVNFVKLVKKSIKAPWVPKIEDPLDTSNFGEYQGKDKNEKSFEGKAPLTSDEQVVFQDF